MKSIICFLCSFLLVTPLFSEDRTASCRFLFFGKQNGGPSAFVMSPSGKIPCPLPFVYFSKAMVCTLSGNDLVLLNEQNETIMSASINAGTKEVFVLVVQTASEPKPAWRAIVVNDDPQTFPPGGAYVVNLNNGDIRFIIGEHKGILNKGMTYGYAMPKELNDFNMATVKFWLNTDSKWQMASETGLRFLPRLRYFFICFRDPISGRPSVRTAMLDQFDP